jgi:hypothetical protein
MAPPASPRGGLDRIGPFHPYLVYAAILLLDLALAALILLALTWIGDTAEDRLFPGGPEWVDF